MEPTLLAPGTQVTTKLGDGVIIEIDMKTYIIPIYHVLLIDGEYANETIYISDPRITPEINQPVPFDGYIEMDEQIPTDAELHWRVANSNNLHTPDDMDGRIGLFCRECDSIMYLHEEQANLTRDKPCPFCGGQVFWITGIYQPKQVKYDKALEI